MILNNDDIILFKEYILSLFKQRLPITLLIDSNICNNIQIQSVKNIDINLYIHNIQLLLTYLKENNIFIKHWKIKSKYNLFNNNYLESILNILNSYCLFFNQQGIITYANNYLVLEQIDKIKAQSYSNIKLILPCIQELNDSIDINVLKYLQINNEKLILIINPYNIQQSIINYSNILSVLSNVDTNIIINKQIYWTDNEIIECLQFVRFLVYYTYLQYKNKEKFIEYIFPIDNKINQANPIIIPFFDKQTSHTFNCDLSNSININCKDLSFPVCAGLQQQIFNGGHFIIDKDKIIDITADEGINGYLNQNLTNTFYQGSCVICKNKYFCEKGCPGFSFQYYAEPCIKINNLCKLEDSILNMLITLYYNFGLFDILFLQNKIPKQQKQQLIKLLNNKGHYEYEYKYLS